MRRRSTWIWWLGLVVPLAVSAAWAQQQPQKPYTLKQAFDDAWARQPEALAAGARQQAAQARKRVAESWTSEPPSVELSARSDRFSGNGGEREYQAGIALPLWLMGERSRSGALADAELAALGSKARASQARIAAQVREAYWSIQKSQVEADVARERLDNTRQLAADVRKRVSAGDLARADLHQAEGAVAGAEVAVEEGNAAFAIATQRLAALTGAPASASLSPLPEAVPEGSEMGDGHPSLKELADRAEVARRAADLAGVQTRAHPELLLGTTRERTALGGSFDNSLTVGIRIPFGSENRSTATISNARAEAIEIETQLRLEQDRALADTTMARRRLDAARSQLAAAERRSALARESRTFFERSFQLGQTDLPTRLRVELEASEAERQAARFRIDVAAAISSLRQALGLLPE